MTISTTIISIIMTSMTITITTTTAVGLVPGRSDCADFHHSAVSVCLHKMHHIWLWNEAKCCYSCMQEKLLVAVSMFANLVNAWLK